MFCSRNQFILVYDNCDIVQRRGRSLEVDDGYTADVSTYPALQPRKEAPCVDVCPTEASQAPTASWRSTSACPVLRHRLPNRKLSSASGTWVIPGIPDELREEGKELYPHKRVYREMQLRMERIAGLPCLKRNRPGRHPACVICQARA